MTDTPERGPGEDPSTPTPRPKPSPSAAAARRARRIGGRPVGGERPDTPSSIEPVGVTKPAGAGHASAGPAAGEPAAVASGGTGEPSPTPWGPPQATVGTQPPAWLNWAPAGVLSVGAVVMAILIVLFSHGVWWGPDPGKVPAGSATNVKREQVLAAAKTCLAATNSYKYTDLVTYERKALACATGGFVGQLRRTIETLVKVNAPKLKSSQTAQINRGGIEAVSPDGSQWTVLLFGQLTVTNSNDPKGRTDPFAAQVRMEQARGKWLISGLNTVSTPV